MPFMGNLGKRQSVLLVDNEEHLGGGQIVGLSVIKILFKNKFMVGLLAPRGAKVASESKRYVGDANIHTIDRLELASAKKSFKDGFLVLKHGVSNCLKISYAFFKYDLIYINSIKLLPISLPILFLLRKNFIVHVHLLYGDTILRFIALACGSSKCQAVVCCSELVHGRLKTFFRNRKLITIRNSLNRDLSDINFENRFDGPIKVGFIGDISISKGADIVFKLASEFPFLEFFLIGRETLDFEANRDNVTVVQNSTDVWSLVREQNINVVIVPSRIPESFGLVAIESCAMSCITIVSSAGYLSSIGQLCGLHVCSDEEKYSQTLADLCEMDWIRLEEMAKLSWNEAQKNYSFDSFEKTIYDALFPLIRSNVPK
jgi:glycosyltransferase involved in cell wall biosynthesis